MSRELIVYAPKPHISLEKEAQIGDVCVAIRGITFSAGDARVEPFTGSIACVTTSGVQDQVEWETCRFVPASGVKKEQVLANGDLLVSTANSKALVGKSCLVQNPPFQCTFGAFVTVLRARQNLVEPAYLASWMRSAESMRYAYKMSSNTTNISNLRVSDLLAHKIFLPAIAEQRRIVAILNQQMAAVERARAAAEAQLELLSKLIQSYLKQSLVDGGVRHVSLRVCLEEVTRGVGDKWEKFRVVGATRAGLAPAKEKVGKNPARYKLVEPGTIFYNPMRILLGSIAMIDDGEEPGITSPDYVVIKGRNGIVHPRWFYYWLRSPEGDAFIKSLTRGAVRERMLFKRLASAELTFPSWEAQVAAANKLSAVAKARRRLEEQIREINKLPAQLLHRTFDGTG